MACQLPKLTDTDFVVDYCRKRKHSSSSSSTGSTGNSSPNSCSTSCSNTSSTSAHWKRSLSAADSTTLDVFLEKKRTLPAAFCPKQKNATRRFQPVRINESKAPKIPPVSRPLQHIPKPPPRNPESITNMQEYKEFRMLEWQKAQAAKFDGTMDEPPKKKRNNQDHYQPLFAISSSSVSRSTFFEHSFCFHPPLDRHFTLPSILFVMSPQLPKLTLEDLDVTYCRKRKFSQSSSTSSTSSSNTSNCSRHSPKKPHPVAAPASLDEYLVKKRTLPSTFCPKQRNATRRFQPEKINESKAPKIKYVPRPLQHTTQPPLVDQENHPNMMAYREYRQMEMQKAQDAKNNGGYEEPPTKKRTQKKRKEIWELDH
ncbi:unnamed protein product [Caenorhabditis brenneri]